MQMKKIEGWDSLHPKQRQLYELLLDHKGDEALTLDDMRENLEVSSLNTAVHHLKQLEKKGYIRRNGDHGEIEVLSAPVRDIIYLNLYGTVGCGHTGFLNDDNIKERIPFPAKKVRVNSNTFLVEALGDSMEPIIHDKDLVLIDRVEPSSGDISIIVYKDDALLKKIYTEKKHVILQSLNSKYEPIIADSDDVRMVGIVRGVVRSFWV